MSAAQNFRFFRDAFKKEAYLKYNREEGRKARMR